MARARLPRVRGIDAVEFWNFWRKVLQESESGTIIVTEGRNDERALRKLLVRGHIITSSQHTVSWVVRRVSILGSRAIIFTDFDRKGEQLARRLRLFLTLEGVGVLDSYREELRRILRGIKTIETLFYIADELLAEAPLGIAFREALLRELSDVVI